jgi:hypothetical protein
MIDESITLLQRKPPFAQPRKLGQMAHEYRLRGKLDNLSVMIFWRSAEGVNEGAKQDQPPPPSS